MSAVSSVSEPFLRLRQYIIISACLVSVSWIPGWVNADPPYQELIICHGFGCKTKSHISLSEKEWRSVADWFKESLPDAKTERNHIRHAIGWMEVIVGRHGPGREDRALDLKFVSRRTGQMDCIDESANTTTYLKLFETVNLLKWHRVIEPIQRRALFNAHWASQIVEIGTGDRYVIDSWFHDNGMLPNVQKREDWLDIPFYTALLDNSIE